MSADFTFRLNHLNSRLFLVFNCFLVDNYDRLSLHLSGVGELNCLWHFFDTIECVGFDLDIMSGNNIEHFETLSSRTYLHQYLHLEQNIIILTSKTTMDSYVAKDQLLERDTNVCWLSYLHKNP